MKAMRDHAEGVRTERETGTVLRAILVLRTIAESEVDLSMKELSDRVNLPMSTMHRLLDLLAREGMVERNLSSKAFRPGLEFFRLASCVVNRMPLAELARPFLQSAMQEVNESCYLATVDHKSNKLLFVASSESKQMLDYRVPINTPYSLAEGASGLVILAWMPEKRIDEVLMTEAEQAGTLKNLPARNDLLLTLDKIRQQGYANTFGQRIKEAVGFFAPVFDARGEVRGSFGFTVPQMRYDIDVAPELINIIIREAGGVSRALGYTDVYPKAAASYSDTSR